MELGSKFQSSKLGAKAKKSLGEVVSVKYHDIFDYPLTDLEMFKWTAGPKTTTGVSRVETGSKLGFNFVSGKSASVFKRLLRKRISARKMRLARKAADVIALIPTVKMVGITGALAMENATKESDIDLITITKQNTLWLTRLATMVLLKVAGIKTRRFGDKNEEDKLCLNMWLDETDLIFRKRNVYTAHELAQIVPLVNKDGTYEMFIEKNNWIKDYWPNAIRGANFSRSTKKGHASIKVLSKISDLVLKPLELLSWKLQLWYMNKKITREVVTKTRELSHPYDWGAFVTKKL